MANSLPPPRPKKPTARKSSSDAATARLFKHNPKALALHQEGKRLKREQNRKEWWAKNGGKP